MTAKGAKSPVAKSPTGPTRQLNIVDALTPKKRSNEDDGGPASVKKIKKEKEVEVNDEKRFVIVEPDDVIQEGMEIDEETVEEKRFVIVKEDDIVQEGMEIDEFPVKKESVEIKMEAPVKKETPVIVKKESPVKVETEKKSAASSSKASPVAEPEKKKSTYGSYLAKKAAGATGPRLLREVPVGKPDCLKGISFVLTGELPSIDRVAVLDLIKKYGG
jgi:replication factor C subunit 1